VKSFVVNENDLSLWLYDLLKVANLLAIDEIAKAELQRTFLRIVYNAIDIHKTFACKGLPVSLTNCLR